MITFLNSSSYRLALNIRGKDYENGIGDAKQPDDLFTMTGVGPFTHAGPKDRPPAILGGKNRLHFEAGIGGVPSAPDHPVKFGCRRV